jgi:hypothetical protein
MKSTITIFVFLCLTISLSAQNTKWNVEYKEDNFSNNSLIDLRYLNETVAGENGFIKLSPDGKSFLTGNGQPIRFWATNGADAAREMSDEQLAKYARFMAKMGVNMIRFHGAIYSKQQGSNIEAVDMAEINHIWRVVAAMKKEGIYTVISPFWAGFFGTMPESWGLGEYKGNTQPWALMYFNEKFKNAYKKWIEVLYTQVNPYTNIALKDDPAVAIIQIKNEDSVLFWTIQGIKSDLKALIEKAFYDWLINKYGTIPNAYSQWNNETMTEDSPQNGRMGIYIIWEATIAQSGGKQKRIADLVQFLSEHQRNFYAEIVAYIKSLGCKQLTNANNWKTASSAYLNDAERWSNEAADVMAVNRYYDPQHIGENNGWRIDPGHKFVGNSALIHPEKLPINIKQSFNKPFLVTESGWNLPHKYQAEGPFLISAYMSLTGVDGFFWFHPPTAGIDSYPYYGFTNLEGGQKAMHRWNASIPGQVMMFPANALLFRKGYLSQGNSLVLEERKLTSIWERKLPLITEEDSFDPNRDSWSNIGNPTQTEIAPIAYLAGPVEVKYGTDNDRKTTAANLNQLLNFNNKIITASTNELKWDYGKGLCTMNAPKAQGVAGFLKNASPTTQLADVKIISDNEYAVVNVVAMDDKPIKESEKILIQVGTVYRPTNWRETPEKVQIDNKEYNGFRIQNTGIMPWQGDNIKMTITINNTTVKSAYLLDLNGVVLKEIYLQKSDNQAIVNLPDNTMYVILNTNSPTITAEDIPQIIENQVIIYPNPAVNGEILIKLNPNTSTKNTLRILTMEGKTVAQYSNLNVGINKISTHKLNNGFYCFELRAKGKVMLKKKVMIEN